METCTFKQGTTADCQEIGATQNVASCSERLNKDVCVAVISTTYRELTVVQVNIIRKRLGGVFQLDI